MITHTHPLSRIMVYGVPNVRKTSAILDTAPRPVVWVHAPGEGGHATLTDTVPVDSPDHHVFPFAKTLGETEKQIIEGIKRGPTTLVLEGLNKLRFAVMDDVTGGKWGEGASFDGGFWSKGDRVMTEFVNLLRQNTIPLVVLTCWEADKATSKEPNSARYTGPDLDGKWGRDFAGMGFAVFRQYLKATDKLDKGGKKILQAWWRTAQRPNLVAGFKANRKLIEKFPVDVPANYTVLFDTWDKLAKEVS